jgi:hypothetical protein
MSEKFGKTGVLSWLPTVLGVCALISFTIVTIVRLTPWPRQEAALPPPAPAFTLPGTTSGPQIPVSVRPAESPSSQGAAPGGQAGLPGPTTAQHSRKPATEPVVTTPPRTTPPAPAAVTVSGTYGVESSYGDSFIGRVALTNVTGSARSWTAVLVFPGNVGSLRTFWVDGQQQPALKQSGRTFTWTSAVTLAAGQTIQLKFDFNRSGSGDTPSTCKVNGASCS